MITIKVFSLTLFLVFFLSCENEISEKVLSNSEKTGNTNLREISAETFQFNGEVGGCGDVFVFRATNDKTKTITVRAEKNNLKLNIKPQTFEIEDNKSIDVFIEDFGKSEFTNREGYCRDDIAGGEKPNRIPAIKGKVSINISKEISNYYNATVILDNVTFQTSDKRKFNLEKVEIKDVRVGWIPG